MDPISVLELFSGVGGMRAALKETGKCFNVISSYEINPTALSIYHHNFGQEKKLTERNIMGMTTQTLENIQPDLLVMSPPCQPFTRQGLKKDTKDTRCSPLLHLLSLIQEATAIPKMILLENVAGFESSEAHEKLLGVLQKRSYNYQEFMLSPSQFGIPNSRLRYYLIAKISPKAFSFNTSEKIEQTLPVCTCYHSLLPEGTSSCSSCLLPLCLHASLAIQKRFEKWHANDLASPRSLHSFQLELSSLLEPLHDVIPHLVERRTLLKYSTVFDIVHPASRGSCCFTKGYAHYVQGTGSVLQHNLEQDLDCVFREIKALDTTDPAFEQLLSSLQLRYFTLAKS